MGPQSLSTHPPPQKKGKKGKKIFDFLRKTLEYCTWQILSSQAQYNLHGRETIAIYSLSQIRNESNALNNMHNEG